MLLHGAAHGCPLQPQISRRRLGERWGQQRRLGVAALLAYDCQVLVCDEPTYAQDRGRTAAIMDALQQEVVERGLTLILSTHDRALAQDYADILYELQEGSLYEVAQSRL